MMNDLIVMIEKSTRMVNLTRKTIGNDNENLQEKLKNETIKTSRFIIIANCSFNY